MATLTIQNPVADHAYSYTQQPGGSLQVDTTLTPGADLGFVAGMDRIVQDVVRWLLTPIGSDPFDPTHGNPLLDALGRPSGPNDATIFESMMLSAQASFLARQTVEVSLGFRGLDEQVDHFEALVVSLMTDPGGTVHLGSICMSFTVVSKTGKAAQVPLVPFTISAIT